MQYGPFYDRSNTGKTKTGEHQEPKGGLSMYLFGRFILFFAYMWTCCCYSQDNLVGHHQLLVVTTPGWDEKQGELSLYERLSDDLAWIPVQTSIPVVVGKNGLAWGIGLHPMNAKIPSKKESDGRSPAGIFSLGSAFGFAPSSEMRQLKWDYLPLHEFIEAVDDPLSYYYNCIVDRREIIPDWHSSEKMGEEPLYAAGIVVNHNFPNPQPGEGSAIFLHIWRKENSGTAGCTAMSLENLNTILSWLDRDKYPVLVQLPIHEYHEMQNAWDLPIKNKNSSPADCNLLDISQVIPNIVLDVRYATSNNFLGFAVYAKPVCYLHKKAADALIQVQKELSSIGLGLKIFDGYRPLSVQQAMWDAVQDERYVSNPAKNKGRHTRGTAVDLTLVDREGNELQMPTPFDDFTEKAHSDYPDLPKKVLQNRALLAKVMKRHGFQQLPTEWWHFDLEGWQDDTQFPPLDVLF
jgi:zinc D-Ala-D-Ala dipeptidase